MGVVFKVALLLFSPLASIVKTRRDTKSIYQSRKLSINTMMLGKQIDENDPSCW